MPLNIRSRSARWEIKGKVYVIVNLGFGWYEASRAVKWRVNYTGIRRKVGSAEVRPWSKEIRWRTIVYFRYRRVLEWFDRLIEFYICNILIVYLRSELVISFPIVLSAVRSGANTYVTAKETSNNRTRTSSSHKCLGNDDGDGLCIIYWDMVFGIRVIPICL